MNKLRKLLQFIPQYEFLLFVIATAFLSGEVWSNQWQLTVDGPAHLYNSIVARELFLHHGTSLCNIFEPNSTLVPNCLGHLILSILTEFFSLDVSDKILHLITVFGMCFSFRFLSRQINPEQPFYSWLIFPFVYSGVYYLGFYNFSLGIVLFLLTSATWIWAEKKSHNVWLFLLLTTLSTLLLLANLIPFLLFVFVVGLRICIRLFKKEYHLFLIDSVFLLLNILPAFIIVAMYYNGRTEITAGHYMWADPKITFSNLIGLHHLAIHDLRQNAYAVFLSISLFSAGITSFFFFLKRRKMQNVNDNLRFVFWSLCWIFLFIVVFAAPNDFGGSGDMTLRLVEISWIFFLLFLSSGKLPKSIIVSMAVISFSIAMIMIQIRKESMF
ncbi:MAG TPA: hypothetical protein VFJ43_17375 [Bacteroidia bacterium]|nr:hypothetical protein [Bacteroidia bacterium]